VRKREERRERKRENVIAFLNFQAGLLFCFAVVLYPQSRIRYETVMAEHIT